MKIFFSAFSALLAASAVQASDRVHYRNPDLPASFPFSSAVVIGNTIHLSGEIGVTYETMTLVEGGVGAETRQIFKNYQATLERLGSSLSDVGLQPIGYCEMHRIS